MLDQSRHGYPTFMSQKREYLLKDFDWVNGTFLLVTPILALTLSAYYIYQFGFSWPLALLSVFFYYATGMSITGGYHRLFAHKSYDAGLALKLFYLFFGAATFQTSVLNWCLNHRFHHKYVDSDKDPYNAKRGFWFSHMGWMLFDKNPVEGIPGADNYIRDLKKDPWIVFQDKYYIPIAIFSGFITPALLGWTFGAPFGAFVFAGLLRMVCVHQFTFFINSLCHMWGKQTYGKANTARDSFWVSLLTYGEGYHNFHHHFQNDYRNGIRWFDFDPTKWMIGGFSWVGLTHNLRRVPDHRIILARVKMDQSLLLQRWEERLEPFEQKLENLRDKIDNCADQIRKMQEEYSDLKKRISARKDLRLSLLSRDIKMAKRELRLRYSHWKKIVSQLEKAHPALNMA